MFLQFFANLDFAFMKFKSSARRFFEEALPPSIVLN